MYGRKAVLLLTKRFLNLNHDLIRKKSLKTDKSGYNYLIRIVYEDKEFYVKMTQIFFLPFIFNSYY